MRAFETFEKVVTGEELAALAGKRRGVDGEDHGDGAGGSM